MCPLTAKPATLNPSRLIQFFMFMNDPYNTNKGNVEGKSLKNIESQ